MKNESVRGLKTIGSAVHFRFAQFLIQNLCTTIPVRPMQIDIAKMRPMAGTKWRAGR